MALACGPTWEAPGLLGVGAVVLFPRPLPGRLMDVCYLPGSRKRISASCERLRDLLPQFDGRREDMASVLEMSVQFLRLAGTLVPSREQHAVSGVRCRSAQGGGLAVGQLRPAQPCWPPWCRRISICVKSPCHLTSSGCEVVVFTSSPNIRPLPTVPRPAPDQAPPLPASSPEDQGLCSGWFSGNQGS